MNGPTEMVRLRNGAEEMRGLVVTVMRSSP